MKINELFEDDDAVSPVIGVILMVAITVILAAVIGTFVLDLGNQVGTSSPTASFSFDDKAAGNDEVVVIHDGGDSIPDGQLSVECEGGSEKDAWPDSTVTAGDSYTCEGITGSDSIQVIWESTDGSNSQVLAEYENN